MLFLSCFAHILYISLIISWLLLVDVIFIQELARIISTHVDSILLWINSDSESVHLDSLDISVHIKYATFFVGPEFISFR
jgi:hypothetical protein